MAVMHSLIKIALLIVAVQFPFDAAAGTYTQLGYDRTEVQSPETDQSPFASPVHQPTLYPIHHQAEIPAEIGSRVPQPTPTSQRDVEPFASSPPEFVIERQLAIYLYFAALIEPGLSTIRLIFPFHFFL